MIRAFFASGAARALLLASLLTLLLALGPPPARAQDTELLEPAPTLELPGEPIHPAAAIMLGSGMLAAGVSVFGTAVWVLATESYRPEDGEAGMALSFGLVGGLGLSAMGVMLAITSLTGELRTRTTEPAWLWIGASASLLGAAAIGATWATIFDEDGFGDDSLALMLTSMGLILSSMTACIGFEEPEPVGVAVAPMVGEGTAGITVGGVF